MCHKFSALNGVCVSVCTSLTYIMGTNHSQKDRKNEITRQRSPRGKWINTHTTALFTPGIKGVVHF